MVYYALVSLVPLLLLLLSALGLLLRFSASAAEVKGRVLAGVDANFGSAVPAAIDQVLTSLQQESTGATIVAVAGLVLTASVLFRHLRMSFRAIWKQDPPLFAPRVRMVVWSTLLERLIAFTMVFSGGLFLVAALALLAVSQWINRTVYGVPVLSHTAEWILPPLTAVVVAAFTYAVLLKVLPPVRVRWSDVWPAALLCAAAWFVAGEALTLYGIYFGRSPSAYGALGALLVFMLWMYVVSQVLFFGAEFCKVIMTARAR